MHLHLTFLRFSVYTFLQGAAGAMSFHDPLEGTEINTGAGSPASWERGGMKATP
jgi:hypothetical protein